MRLSGIQRGLAVHIHYNSTVLLAIKGVPMFYNSTRRLHLLEKREFVNSLGTSGGNKISWYIRYVTVLYNIIAILYFLFSFLPKIRTLLKAKYCEFLDLSDVSKLTVIKCYVYIPVTQSFSACVQEYYNARGQANDGAGSRAHLSTLKETLEECLTEQEEKFLAYRSQAEESRQDSIEGTRTLTVFTMMQDPSMKCRKYNENKNAKKNT